MKFSVGETLLLKNQGSEVFLKLLKETECKVTVSREPLKQLSKIRYTGTQVVKETFQNKSRKSLKILAYIFFSIE